VNVGETIRQIEKKYIRTDLPPFNVGDTIKMRIKVKEADKVRLHPFEGIVIRKAGPGCAFLLPFVKCLLAKGLSGHSRSIPRLLIAFKLSPKEKRTARGYITCAAAKVREPRLRKHNPQLPPNQFFPFLNACHGEADSPRTHADA